MEAGKQRWAARYRLGLGSGVCWIEIFKRSKLMLAEAYLRCNGLYVFAIGTQFSNGRIPVFRLGGHREEHETGWQCTVCEVREETGLRILPTLPTTTYLMPNGDDLDVELEQVSW